MERAVSASTASAWRSRATRARSGTHAAAAAVPWQLLSYAREWHTVRVDLPSACLGLRFNFQVFCGSVARPTDLSASVIASGPDQATMNGD